MRAILLLNLGSPASPGVHDVRNYLKEFLMDPYVIDLPYPLRKLIVSGFILPTRPKKSAEAYTSIWSSQGSPLVAISKDLTTKLREKIPYPIELAMRYGKPDIESTLLGFYQKQQFSELLLIPLYPQYAMSTVETGVVSIKKIIQKHQLPFQLKIFPVFYNQADYLDALYESARSYLNGPFDHLLFSYHGLPERHLTKTDPTRSHCLQHRNCCEMPSPAHATCYRYQCLQTTQGFVERAKLSPEKFSIAFQSRLGKAKWLEPYTEETIKNLASQGVKKLLVICPAFVADCLETLEEIGIRGREVFLAAGGESLILIPCLNSHSKWIETLAKWCQTENI